MSTKHTPGPWEWDGNACGYDENNEAPWLVQATWRSQESKAVLTGSIKCQSEADARLIAAAPELLEALQTLMGPIDGLQANLDAAKKARAAIAKATGAPQ